MYSIDMDCFPLPSFEVVTLTGLGGTIVVNSAVGPPALSQAVFSNHSRRWNQVIHLGVWAFEVCHKVFDKFVAYPFDVRMSSKGPPYRGYCVAAWYEAVGP